MAWSGAVEARGTQEDTESLSGCMQLRFFHSQTLGIAERK